MVNPKKPICDICKKLIRTESEFVCALGITGLIPYHLDCHNRAVGIFYILNFWVICTLDNLLNKKSFSYFLHVYSSSSATPIETRNMQLQDAEFYKEYYRRH
jgi:hypothetical protein